MNIKQQIANKRNYGGLRKATDIRYVVIHYTANDGDSDESNAKYFQGIIGASAHYFVDDNSITQSVPEANIAWSVGGGKLDNQGGTLHGKVTNTNSISIELCDSVRNGRFDFTENTLKQAANLVRSIMQKYNIPIENVVRHYDVTGKICPRPFVIDGNVPWKNFKSRIVKAEVGYSVHISTIGWQDDRYNGDIAGTEGRSLAIEALKVYSGSEVLLIQGHIQGKGWTDIKEGNILTIGTTGESKRLEAVRIDLKNSSRDVEYRVHVQDEGWQDWVRNFQVAGTEGQSKRLEAIQIRII